MWRHVTSCLRLLLSRRSETPDAEQKSTCINLTQKNQQAIIYFICITFWWPQWHSKLHNICLEVEASYSGMADSMEHLCRITEKALSLGRGGGNRICNCSLAITGVRWMACHCTCFITLPQLKNRARLPCLSQRKSWHKRTMYNARIYAKPIWRQCNRFLVRELLFYKNCSRLGALNLRLKPNATNKCSPVTNSCDIGCMPSCSINWKMRGQETGRITSHNELHFFTKTVHV